MQLPVSTSSLPLHNLHESVQGSDDEKKSARLNEAAEAFEGAFLKILLKSMRDTIPEGGIFDRQQMAAFEEMRDGALADSLSNRGATGIAQMVVRQLGGTPKQPEPLSIAVAVTRRSLAGTPVSTYERAQGSEGARQRREFIVKLLPAARRAAKALGVDSAVIVAQAALETGWGKHIPKNADGGSSNNLFGVKAGSRWQGQVTQQQTTEFLGGKLRNVVAQFRAYSNSAESVSDYVSLISGSERYAPALNAKSPAHYLKALQDGGYATDPDYAKKIQAIMNSPDMSSANDH